MNYYKLKPNQTNKNKMKYYLKKLVLPPLQSHLPIYRDFLIDQNKPHDDVG